MRFLDAVVCLSLAAAIHQNDGGVRATAQRLAKRVERRHRYLLFNVINSPSPYLFMTGFLATLPDEILQMDTTPLPAPHIQLSQTKASVAGS